MNKEVKVLKAEKRVQVRFSEVDSMGIVWHGAYPLYFEDAREEFGSLYHLEYLRMYEFGFYAPLVELTFNYKRPIKHRDIINVVITYKDTDAAKILFDYEIYNVATGELVATGHSTQVFLDRNYELVWSIPDFFIEWKKMNGII
jgi:acyl-CoA thioester hydrolase